jgi:flagellar motility protein MotE (MotC chaperone)
VEESGEKSRNWFFFCDECFPGKDAYKSYDPDVSTQTPSNTNNNKNTQKIAKTPIKPLEIISNNDSGYFPDSPTNLNEQRVMKILEKITKQCEDIQEELNTYRQTSQQDLKNLKANVKKLMKSIDEQREIIETLEHESKTMKTELFENITNYIQQQKLSNTIEISGLVESVNIP